MTPRKRAENDESTDEGGDRPESREEPDEACQPAVEPHPPEEARSDAQSGLPAHATGFDPSRPVATSSPPVSAMTGVPDLPMLNEDERRRQNEAAASTGGGATDAAVPEASGDGAQE